MSQEPHDGFDVTTKCASGHTYEGFIHAENLSEAQKKAHTLFTQCKASASRILYIKCKAELVEITIKT